MLSTKPSTAYFVAQKGPKPGTPSAPEVLLKIRYRPPMESFSMSSCPSFSPLPPLSRKYGNESWMMLRVPQKFVSN